MKFSKLKRRNLVVISTIILLVVLSGITYKFLTQESSDSESSIEVKTSEEIAYTSDQEIKEAQKRNGIPFKRGSVDSSNLDYYWLDGTVVDGSSNCYVFNRQTYQIYGSTYTTAGFGSPSKSGSTYYQNQEYDIDFIEQTLDSVCNYST